MGSQDEGGVGIVRGVDHMGLDVGGNGIGQEDGHTHQLGCSGASPSQGIKLNGGGRCRLCSPIRLTSSLLLMLPLLLLPRVLSPLLMLLPLLLLRI